jgi:hypothetical protein
VSVTKKQKPFKHIRACQLLTQGAIGRAALNRLQIIGDQ